jgi:hypothetical protein
LSESREEAAVVREACRYEECGEYVGEELDGEACPRKKESAEGSKKLCVPPPGESESKEKQRHERAKTAGNHRSDGGEQRTG